MGLFRIIIFFVCISIPCQVFSQTPSSLCQSQKQSRIPNRILYLIYSGHIPSAIQLYQDYCNSTGRHDFELIQQMGLFTLEQGYKNRDPEIQLMDLFGAGISIHERALYIL